MIAPASVLLAVSTDYEDESSETSDTDRRDSDGDETEQVRIRVDRDTTGSIDIAESSGSASSSEHQDSDGSNEAATSHPSLTPTPPTPDQEDQDSASESARVESGGRQLDSGGPALVASADFNPDTEYLSDPDLHDERPPKAGPSGISRGWTSDSESDRSSPIHSPASLDELSGRTEIRAGGSSSSTGSSSPENEERSSESQVTQPTSDNLSAPPVTASEARADSFVDGTTIAEEIGSLDLAYSQTIENRSNQDDTTEENSTLNLSVNVSEISSRLNSGQQSLDDIDFELESYGADVSENLNDDGVRSSLETFIDDLVDTIEREVLSLTEELRSRAPSEQLSDQQVRASEATSSADEDMAEAHNRKIFTSSMYYDDPLESFPTLEQQVERSRSIARQLEEEEEKETVDGSETSPEVSASSGLDSERQRSPKEADAPKRASLSNKRASTMFRRRRERMNRFTLVASESLDAPNRQPPPGPDKSCKRRASAEPAVAIDRTAPPASNRRRQSEVEPRLRPSASLLEDRAAWTDSEYEAPRIRRRPTPARATTTPFGERTNRHVEVDGGDQSGARFRPFLDPSTLKDIQRLRNWSPFEAFNEHNSVSPEACLKLVQGLKGNDSSRPASRGAQLFEQRQLQSCEWVVDGAQSPARSACMVTSEGETSPLAEVQAAPMVPVARQVQPQLELATVSRVASHGTSARQVIECDSADLLTSRDDEEDMEAEAALSPLDCRPRARRAQLHQSTLVRARRPRVATPTWRAPGSGATGALWRRSSSAAPERPQSRPVARASSSQPDDGALGMATGELAARRVLNNGRSLIGRQQGRRASSAGIRCGPLNDIPPLSLVSNLAWEPATCNFCTAGADLERARRECGRARAGPEDGATRAGCQMCLAPELITSSQGQRLPVRSQLHSDCRLTFACVPLAKLAESAEPAATCERPFYSSAARPLARSRSCRA